MAFGKLFVVSAPSGSGKTCLVNEVLKACGQKVFLKRAITYTTRPPREGEVDGEHYHFISVENKLLLSFLISLFIFKEIVIRKKATNI